MDFQKQMEKRYFREIMDNYTFSKIEESDIVENVAKDVARNAAKQTPEGCSPLAARTILGNVLRDMDCGLKDQYALDFFNKNKKDIGDMMENASRERMFSVEDLPQPNDFMVRSEMNKCYLANFCYMYEIRKFQMEWDRERIYIDTKPRSEREEKLIDTMLYGLEATGESMVADNLQKHIIRRIADEVENKENLLQAVDESISSMMNNMPLLLHRHEEDIKSKLGVFFIEEENPSEILRNTLQEIKNVSEFVKKDIVKIERDYSPEYKLLHMNVSRSQGKEIWDMYLVKKGIESHVTVHNRPVSDISNETRMRMTIPLVAEALSEKETGKLKSVGRDIEYVNFPVGTFFKNGLVSAEEYAHCNVEGFAVKPSHMIAKEINDVFEKGELDEVDRHILSRVVESSIVKTDQRCYESVTENIIKIGNKMMKEEIEDKPRQRKAITNKWQNHIVKLWRLAEPLQSIDRGMKIKEMEQEILISREKTKSMT